MDAYFLPWWIWVVGGFLLMGLEMITPAGFFLFFVGVAAVGTGLATYAGLATSLLAQGISVLVVMSAVLLLRKHVLGLLRLAPVQGGPAMDSLVGETATAVSTLAPEAFGKVELRGTVWSARNVGPASIPAAARCRVEKVDGLTLEVRL